jgi:hypothetical protein
MTACDWIICERTGRWAAALRTGAARRSSLTGSVPRIYETRTLDELAEQLAARPLSLALMEAHASNVGKLLQWLGHNSQRFPHAHFVAFLDRMLTARSDFDVGQPCGEAEDVVAPLLEAGAAEIAVSPRRLQHIFALADKHAASVRSLSRRSFESQLTADWARSQLPWQTDPTRS